MCDICFGAGADGSEGGYSLDHVYVGGCGHTACIGCVRDHVTRSIKDNSANVTCFSAECEAAIGGGDVHAILEDAEDGKQTLDLYEQLLTEAAMSSMGKLVYCPNKKCGAPIVSEDGASRVDCLYCKKAFCLSCDVPWHEGSTCE